MNATDIKKQILYKIIEIIDNRIESTKIALAAAKESRDNETKCSVGDKYETSRTMMQLEVEKNRVLLNQTLNIKNKLTQININKKHDQIEFGSLVNTNHEKYFIAFAVGKIEIGNEQYYCISMVSPVGNLLKDKKVNDTIKFQGKEITILEIA
jgi:transcription elongation GreA/GreB family factor